MCRLIPANVHAEVEASTAFGNKYVALSSPETPVAQRISGSDVIDASACDHRIQHPV